MSDKAVREEALNVERSFIVQAPAGSGKTSLLISRFICLLADAEQPEEILAITFTRKATAEMRKRILHVLDPENKCEFHQDAANIALEKVRRRSAELGWNLLEQPSRLQIMTIDALCTSLVRRMPWASRFGSLPGLADDASLQQHYESAAVNLYESANNNEILKPALKTLLNHLDNNSGKFKSLIVQLLEKRDQWLRHLASSTFSNEDRDRMENYWQSLLKNELNKTYDMMPVEAREKLGFHRIENLQPAHVESWKYIAASIFTQGRTLKKKISDSDVPESLTKEEFKAIIGKCGENPALVRRLAEILDVYPSSPVYDDNQWEVLRACSVVLQYAVAELKLEFRKHGQVDYIEIAQNAVKSLGSVDDPTDLSLVLDYHYRHIMVDEFQDTSVTQRDLLELLTAGWQPDDGRTIFLVGDPMQSIYRFREAEVGIYLSVMKNSLGNLQIEPLNLTNNFRSNKELVDWFNTVFAPSFPGKAELETGSVPYVKCTTEKESSNSNAVKIRIQNVVSETGLGIRKHHKKENEASLLIEDLKQYRKENPNTDNPAAVVLVRNRKHASEIVPELMKENIDFYASDFNLLSLRPVVEDLLSLTRALCNLADRVSWMAILRAPWCGLKLADLLILAGERKSIIWNQLNDSNVESGLSEDGQLRVRRLREVLKKTFSCRGQIEMRYWINDCWLLLGGPACYSAHDSENATLFFDLVEQHARGSSAEGLSKIEQSIEQLYAVAEGRPDDNWLHLSTIHGAKGLEYDAVFLPRFNETQTGRSDKPLLAWSEFILPDEGNQMLLSPIVPTDWVEPGGMYSFLLRWDQNKDLIELMRQVYVACTRAKKSLYIYSDGKVNGPDDQISPSDVTVPHNSMIGLIWPGIVASNYAFVEAETYVVSVDDGVEDKEDAKKFPIHRLSSEWELPQPPQHVAMLEHELESPDYLEAIDFDWAGSTALWIGNVVHEWLEKIVRSGLQNWDSERLIGERGKWRIRLMAMGMSSDEEIVNEALDRIQSAIANVLSDPKGQWILSDQHSDSEAELRLTGYSKGQYSNVILDRTFVDQDGTRWIIDYKSGTTTGNVDDFLNQEVERYREQLTQYKSVMSGMDSRPIRTALYFPMFPAWREIV